VTGRVNCCAAPGFQAARSNASMLFSEGNASENRTRSKLMSAPTPKRTNFQLGLGGWIRKSSLIVC
jgi:hypothetical protein